MPYRRLLVPSDMHIRLLTPDDEPFLWQALYYAIHVPPGQDPPAPEIVKQPNLARYVVGWMLSLDDLGLLLSKTASQLEQRGCVAGQVMSGATDSSMRRRRS